MSNNDTSSNRLKRQQALSDQAKTDLKRLEEETNVDDENDDDNHTVPTENETLLTKSKFSVTKLRDLTDDMNATTKTVTTVTEEVVETTADFGNNKVSSDRSNSVENAFLASSSASNSTFNRQAKFKQQNSIIDPFPHFDNYRNNLLSLSTSFSNTNSKLSSNVNSNYSIDADNSSNNVQYENTITPSNTINQTEAKSLRPTLRELQTAVGSPKLDVPSKSFKMSRLGRSLNNRLSFSRSRRDKSNDQKKKSIIDDEVDQDKLEASNYKRKSSRKKDTSIIKFGWIEGVLIRCILNIFGIMIFMRLTWVVGQAGLGLSSVIIAMATLVTLITALSTSAISTNGEIKGGGAYYLISRSLGPEFGGAIGIVFSFANAVASSMYVIGFSETLVSVFNKYGIKIIDGQINDVRVIGLITVVILMGIALVGMKWEAKVQSFLLIILVVAFGDFLVGAFLKPNAEQRSKGFVGFNLGLIQDNFMPDYREGEDFAHVFAIFFPAVTGILAGANISGNLKNPQQAIPKGTILSIFITSVIYLLFAWIAGITVQREASGIVPFLESNGSDLLMTLASTTAASTTTATTTTMMLSNATDCKIIKCKYGLLNDYEVISLVSVYGPIIVAGIFSASLSSALASLVSAPKIFQAVGKDKIFPKIEYFAKGYGKDNEPWRGYVLTFFIACLFIIIGELNEIAPIISNFFLMSYALVNYACFDASVSKTPGWRPSFKYYNKWISFFGALLCITIMFLIKWWAALVSFLSIIAIYAYVKQAKPDVNWGSTRQAHIYRKSLEYSLKLMNIKEHVKNYRPNFLVLTGEPSKRPALCDFIASISKSTSLMICANVNKESEELLRPNLSDIHNWLRKRKLKSFFTEVNAKSLRSGAQCLMQSAGIGKLRPNAIAMGFKNNWQYDKVESAMEYYNLINDVFQMEFSLAILRVEGGLDYSNLLGDESFLNTGNSSSSDEEFFVEYEDNEDLNSKIYLENELNNKLIFNEEELKDVEEDVFHKKLVTTQLDESIISNTNSTPERIESTSSDTKKVVAQMSTSESKNGVEDANSKDANANDPNTTKRRASNSSKLPYKSTELMKLKNTKINTGILQGMNIFHNKYQDGFVDVYWLHDDGGLTVLIPYLLKQRKHWKKCKLRVFIQTSNKTGDIAKEQKNMEMLLTKFRLEYHQVIILSNLRKKPAEESVELFNKLIENWRLKENESQEEHPHKISDTTYQDSMHKINYYLRIREVLLEYSKESTLIFVTITVPNKIRTCPGIYMSYLDVISYKMPPIVMIRGNQNQVITYYS